jgi:RNA polymerase sigma-70 factor (ECF subfamily)
MKVSARSGDPQAVEASSPSAPGLAVPDAPALDIDALYTAHAPFIGRVLIRLTGDGPHIDDLIQETFIIAFRKRDTFDGRSAARTWLYGIAARLALRHRRGAGRWLRALGLFAAEPAGQAAPPDRALETALDQAHAATAVRAALDRLPFKQREVFVLYELEELDGQAIAELLAIPVGTVWTRLHHGRKRFQEILKKRRSGDDA